MRIRDIYRPSHTTKPGRGEAMRVDNLRLMREEWADFCTNHCPHPERKCERGTCQLQWGGLEIAEEVKDGALYCKHIKPFSLDLYGQYCMAFDGPPERGKNNENPSGI